MAESAAHSPHEETLELILLAQTGEDEAMARLVSENAPLVRAIVRKYIGRGTEYEDLYQIGCMGLVKAIRNFDTSYNVRFSTYAVPMIAGEIKRFLRDDGMVKVSRSLKELAARAAAAQSELSFSMGREPGVVDIAESLGESPEDVAMALEASRPHLSIYEPAYGEDGETAATLLDRVPGEGDEAEATIDRVLLKELLGTLEPRERSIIVLRYFADKTQGEIAQLLGVSQVQVSRLEGRILRKLREQAR
ncbi:MAG: SigB/SigF/SigG family RNA polymerase sigma factor [Christensenellaceae bacterium]|jgi:RNA polymerase sporulation-specific sigma factor|nr:SigB/SigF/SigG family RNA polymerase sigma factor [Christensenellaceae bacterium]